MANTNPSIAAPATSIGSDLKGWLSVLGKVIAISIAVGGLVMGLLAAYFQTRENANVHEVQYIQHVGQYLTHLEQAKGRDSILMEQAKSRDTVLGSLRSDVADQRVLQQVIHENQIRLMERFRVQAAPAPPARIIP